MTVANNDVFNTLNFASKIKPPVLILMFDDSDTLGHSWEHFKALIMYRIINEYATQGYRVIKTIENNAHGQVLKVVLLHNDAASDWCLESLGDLK